MSEPDMLLGLPIIENEHLGIPETREVKRTWKERLFSLPWKPFKKTRHELYWKDDGTVWVISGYYHCHPDTEQKIRNQCK